MEKIDRETLEVPEEDIDNVLVGEMVASLTSESIKRAYTCSYGRNNNMYIFMGLLHMMAQDYIKTKGLAPGDPDYSQIVDNLAALTGFTNDDYCLDSGEMQYCIENELIPINMSTINGPLEPGEPVCFINKNRFSDIIELASMIMTHYESDDPDKPKQSNMDGFMNLLLCGRETCDQIYQIRKQMAAWEREHHIKNMNIDIQPGGDALDFEL